MTTVEGKVQESTTHGVVTELLCWSDDDTYEDLDEAGNVQRVESLAVDREGQFILFRAGEAEGYCDADPEILGPDAVCDWLRKRIVGE